MSGFTSSKMRNQCGVCMADVPTAEWAVGLSRGACASDIDFVLESHGKFMFADFKSWLRNAEEGQDVVGRMSRGQARLYAALAAQKGTTVFLVDNTDTGGTVWVPLLLDKGKLVAGKWLRFESEQTTRDALNAWMG